MAQIDKPTDYFDNKLWTGNETDNRDITGFNFQPDFAWIKARNNSYGHSLFDAVRGVNQYLCTNADSGNTDQPSSGYISQFNSDGYRLKHGSSTFRNVNDGDASTTYVSWNWKAGTTSGIATNGETDITPSGYSFNQTSGFSIVKYTGTGTSGEGVPHGLGKKPQFYMVKRTDTTGSWQVFWQPDINTSNATKYMLLNSGGAEGTNNNRWNGWQPDTTNFYLGNSTEVNASGGTYIAYVFANIKGFSKLGSYTGNGDADGPFVYTGFKPAWMFIKSNSNAGNWLSLDDKRTVQNIPSGTPINLNESNAEDTNANYAIDFLSNGFKLRNTNGNIQNNGYQMFYMAFAAEPLVGSNNIPATAV